MVLPGASRYFPDFWLPAKNSSPTSSIWKKRMNGSRAFLRWAGESYARAAPQKAVRADLPRPTHNSLLSMSGTNIGPSVTEQFFFYFWWNRKCTSGILYFDSIKRGEFPVLTLQKGGNFGFWPNKKGEISYLDPMKWGNFTSWSYEKGEILNLNYVIGSIFCNMASHRISRRFYMKIDSIK